MTFYSYFSSLEDIYECLYTTLFQYDNNASIVDCSIKIDISEWDKYYMKIIESDQGLRILYQSMQSAPRNHRMIHHIIISLTNQYKLNLLTREEYVEEFTKMKTSLLD